MYPIEAAGKRAVASGFRAQREEDGVMQCACYDAGHSGGQHRAPTSDVDLPTQEEQREWIRCQNEADDDQYCSDCDSYQKSKKS